MLRARELEVLGHPDSDRLWKRIAERAGAADFVHPEGTEVGSPERLRAELAEQRAHEALQRDAHAEGKAGLLAAAELFEEAGLPGSALMVRTRTLIADLDEGDEGGESGSGGESGEGGEAGSGGESGEGAVVVVARVAVAEISARATAPAGAGRPTGRRSTRRCAGPRSCAPPAS